MRLLFVWAVAAVAAAVRWAGSQLPAATKVSPSTNPETSATLTAPPPPPAMHELAPMPTTAPSPTMAASRPEPALAPAPVGGRLAKVVVTSDLDLCGDQIAPSLVKRRTLRVRTRLSASRRRQRDVPAGAFARPWRGNGFVWRRTRARRAREHDVPGGRRSAAPADLHLRTGIGHAHDRVGHVDRRKPAGAVWISHGGDIRRDHQVGQQLQGGEVSLYGGGYDTFEPSVDLGWTQGKWDYYVSASYKHSDDGIESPTPSYRPIHDDTDQEKLFVYSTYHIDDTSRLSFFINASDADFQIPEYSQRARGVSDRKLFDVRFVDRKRDPERAGVLRGGFVSEERGAILAAGVGVLPLWEIRFPARPGRGSDVAGRGGGSAQLVHHQRASNRRFGQRQRSAYGVRAA